MAVDIHQLVLVATDLTLASVLSFAFYAFACLCLAVLASCTIFFSSVEVVKRVKRKISRKGRAIVMNTVGRKRVEKLDRAVFRILAVCPKAECEGISLAEKEYSSNTRRIQLPVVKEKAAMQTERRLSLEGKSRTMKTSSWTEASTEDKRKLSPKGKNGFLSPAFLIAVLLAPVNIMRWHVKKTSHQLFTKILKSQD